jgi:hypothetical protein
MDFKAEILPDGTIDVKCIVEKIGADVIIHVPSFPIIQKLKDELKEKEKK